jgi:hypothetical protein
MVLFNYINDKLIKALLKEAHGIGKTKMTYKDYLSSLMATNYCYVKRTSEESNPNKQFVGIVNSDFTISSSIGFYDNDDHAMAFGVPIGGDYYLSRQNTYGMPFGIRKKVSEPYATD